MHNTIAQPSPSPDPDTIFAQVRQDLPQRRRRLQSLPPTVVVWLQTPRAPHAPDMVAA